MKLNNEIISLYNKENKQIIVFNKRLPLLLVAWLAKIPKLN